MGALILQFALVLAILITPMVAGAQTINNKLRGVLEVRVDVETLPESAKQCGLTEEDLRRTLMFPVSQTKLNVTTARGVPTLNLSINTLKSRSFDGCSGNMTLEVYQFRNIDLGFAGTRTYEVRFWSEGGIFTASTGRFPSYVKETVEDAVKKFLTDWALDNK